MRFRFFILLFLVAQFGHAQFTGGEGDGFYSKNHSGNLNGEQLFVFHGGYSDGFDSQIRGVFLNSNGDCASGIL
jgi:hypothetical protein